MEPQQALKLLVGILNQVTLINRGGGRESGLTVDERAAISQSAHAINQALTAKPEAQPAPKAKRNRK